MELKIMLAYFIFVTFLWQYIKLVKSSNVHYLHPLISHFVSLHFNGHFTGEPGLAGVY